MQFLITPNSIGLPITACCRFALIDVAVDEQWRTEIQVLIVIALRSSESLWPAGAFNGSSYKQLPSQNLIVSKIGSLSPL